MLPPSVSGTHPTNTNNTQFQTEIWGLLSIFRIPADVGKSLIFHHHLELSKI